MPAVIGLAKDEPHDAARGVLIDRNGEAKAVTQIVNVTGYRYEAAQFEVPRCITLLRGAPRGRLNPRGPRLINEALDCIQAC